MLNHARQEHSHRTSSLKARLPANGCGKSYWHRSYERSCLAPARQSKIERLPIIKRSPLLLRLAGARRLRSLASRQSFLSQEIASALRTSFSDAREGDGGDNHPWQRGRLAPARRSNNGNRSMIGSHSLFLCLAGARQLRSCDRRQDLLAHPPQMRRRHHFRKKTKATEVSSVAFKLSGCV